MHMPLLLASIVIWRDVCHFAFDEASFRRPITRAASLCSQALLAMGAHFTCLHASVDAARFLSRYTCTRLLVRRSRGISFSARHARGLRSQAWPYFHRGLTQPPSCFAHLHASVNAARFSWRIFTRTRLLARRSRAISPLAHHSRGLCSQARLYSH
jgi:hypothetical protein